jgi:hypothetical protein
MKSVNKIKKGMVIKNNITDCELLR